MKQKLCPKKALAVILSAAMALSPAITASAETLDVSPEATPEEILEAFEAAADAESEETEESEGVQDAEKAEVTEDLPLFEQVDPEEEGLELADVKEVFEAEVTDVETGEPDPDEQTRVIIVMEGDSVLDAGFDTENLAENDAAMNLSESIVAEQEQQVEKIEEQALDGAELDVNYNLSILTNAVSADVAFGDIESIANVDGVKAVYVAQKYEPQATDAEINTITAGDMVGSYDTWATGYTGAGTRIAIIDTGIDADHPSFDGGAFDAHLQETAADAGKSVADYNLLDESEIAAVLPNLNATQRDGEVSASDLYLSEKIPFAFNYVDKNLDVTHDNDDEGDHGTHVSGIATANTYVPGADGYVRQAQGVVGVAPDAQLITMKVFGTNGGAYSDDYMAAIEDALLLKADVVNLSLGSSVAGYSSDSEAYVNDIFKKLEGTSTVVSISAGNSGRFGDDTTVGANLRWDVNMDTVGSPGSYYNAFTVASAVNSGFTGNFFATSDGKNIFYTDGNDTLAPKFSTLDVSADGSGTEYPFVFLAAKGEPADYEGVDVTDKIVFVQRGAITFGEKQMNAEAAGAKAIVIYNNTSGTISMTLQGSTAVIPAVSITLDEGAGIAKSAEQISEKVYTGTITVVATPSTNYEAAGGYTMSDFSSVGVPETLDLKPEITAPGGNIYSTRDGGSYGNMSGTSMSAPSIAGQTALLEQYIKENGLADQEGLSIRTLAQALMMSTATPLNTDNDSSEPEYSPRAQGAGLANVHDAVTSPAYVLVGDKDGNDGKAKVVLGDDPSRSGSYSFSFDVYNLTDEPQYYALDSSVLTEELIQNYFIVAQSHKLQPEVTLTADDTALVYDLNFDGKVDKKDRKVLLQVVNGTKELNLVSQNEDYFDFNKDGIVDTKDVYTFGKQLKSKDSVVDLGSRVMQVKDSTKVSVSINLSAADREYLEQFENGMYVDGFVYVNGPVNLSVPFLAFYGSWMDASMYEDFDYLEYKHNPDYEGFTYSGMPYTNFLTIFPYGDLDEENEYFYVPNMYEKDEKYIPDRNAISSDAEENGTVLGSQYYSLIRNASRVIATITDRNTGEEYFRTEELENYAEFSYNGEMQNYIQWQDLLWAGTDKEGNPLEDGTEVDITLEAVPSYYDDVEDPSTLDGAGLYLSTPMAIDNKAPELVGGQKNEDGTYTIVINDNRYTAAAIIYDRDGYRVGKYAANQEEKGADIALTVEAPADVFYVDLVDYALNESVWRVNFTGHEDTEYVTSLTVEQEEMELNVGDIVQFEAKVGPEWLAEGFDGVTWSSDNMNVVYCLKSGMAMAYSAGEATVTVTTDATTEEGEQLTAQIKVTVVDPKAEEEKPEENSDEKSDENSEEITEPVENPGEVAEPEEPVVDDTNAEAVAEASSEASSEEAVETPEELGGND